MVDRIIKFRRAFFTDDGKFSHFGTWGVNLYGMMFKNPPTNNFATEFIDQQFTGLLDKDGKEIFEGDVLHCDSAFHNCIVEVKCGWYDDGMANDVLGFYLYLPDRFEWAFRKRDFERGDYKVIGNVRENPELLTTQRNKNDG